MASKRIMLTVDENLYRILSHTEGMGNADAEKVVNIVRAYFSEKGIISGIVKKKLELE